MTRTGPGILAQLVAAPLLAVGFLTIAPVPSPGAVAPGSMGWAVALFPLVGAVLGVLIAGAGLLLVSWFPIPVAAALLLAMLLAMTGALHLDGLMDSFDGLFGGRDPEGRLSIMRDSRVGSFGMAAGASLLLAEYAALATLPEAGRSAALVLTLALSRWAMAVTLWAFPAAGSSGLAAGLKPQVRWYHAAVATLLAGGVAAACAGWTAVGPALTAPLLVALGGRLAVVRLGGINGDICGGLGLLVEAATLVLCSATVR